MLPRLFNLNSLADTCVSESVGERGDYIATKIRYSRDRFVRQFMTHGELIYHFMVKAGFPVNTREHYTAYNYHKTLWPPAYNTWGRVLSCWRNGRGKRPFSFTWHSLSYAYALARGVLTLYGYHTQRVVLDNYIMELVPEKKPGWPDGFHRAYADIGGWVLSHILHPHIPYPADHPAP